ncbi:MAG: hypothetical protein M9893_03195 [Pyrinomonadaceae bacterium]|nr:hypothetical protein [Pyrinomonadaceae bacterium]
MLNEQSLDLELQIFADLRRRAFAMTETELKVIAALAIIGDSSNPKTGNNTPAAIGIPRYSTKAKNRFWRISFIVARLSCGP